MLGGLLADYNSDEEQESSTSSLNNNNNNKEEEEFQDQEIEKKSGLFSNLPSPKFSQKEEENHGKEKNTPQEKKTGNRVIFTVPILSSTLKEAKEAEDEDLLPRQKKIRSQSDGNFLSFLPAPKNTGPIEEEEKEPVNKKLKTTSTENKEITIEPIPSTFLNEEEEEEQLKGSPTQTTKRLKKTPSQKRVVESKRRIPLSFHGKIFSQLLECNEKTTQSQSDDQFTVVGPQLPSTNVSITSQYEYPESSNNYQSTYSSQLSFSEPLPRDFRGFNESDVIGIDMNEIRKSFPKYQIPEQQSELPNTQYIPSKNAKRQHHISELLWNHQMQRDELEIKRIESRRTKRESRSKYGW